MTHKNTPTVFLCYGYLVQNVLTSARAVDKGEGPCPPAKTECPLAGSGTVLHFQKSYINTKLTFEVGPGDPNFSSAPGPMWSELGTAWGLPPNVEFSHPSDLSSSLQ